MLFYGIVNDVMNWHSALCEFHKVFFWPPEGGFLRNPSITHTLWWIGHRTSTIQSVSIWCLIKWIAVYIFQMTWETSQVCELGKSKIHESVCRPGHWFLSGLLLTVWYSHHANHCGSARACSESSCWELLKVTPGPGIPSVILLFCAITTYKIYE